MKFDIIPYMELNEALLLATDTCSKEKGSIGYISLTITGLERKIKTTILESDLFTVTKTEALKLFKIIEDFNKYHNALDASGGLNFDTFDKEIPSYQFNYIENNVKEFKTVFSAEAQGLFLFSINPVSIYDTQRLIERSSDRFPPDLIETMGAEILFEFQESGKCLALELARASGFHALRAIELMMENYLKALEPNSPKPKSWSAYLSRFEKHSQDTSQTKRPSGKTISALDRLRHIDRNPIMHPEVKLDSVSAESLFNITSITLIELALDMKRWST